MFEIKNEKLEMHSPGRSHSSPAETKQEPSEISEGPTIKFKREKNSDEESPMVNSEKVKYEQCAICLLYMQNQLLARPIECKHSFCLECIEEWSRVSFLN